MKRYTIYQKVAARTGPICGICTGSLLHEWEELCAWRFGNYRKVKRTDINIDLDHIIPKSLLPKQDWWKNLENLQLAHRTCNQAKGNKVFSWED